MESKERRDLHKDVGIWFEFHPPTKDQIKRYGELRDMFRMLAHKIVDSTPVCADQMAALRKLRGANMAVNMTIACNELTNEFACNELTNEVAGCRREALLAEKHELDKKIERLISFRRSSDFDMLVDRARDLLNKQLEAMREYSQVLSARIEVLNKAEE